MTASLDRREIHRVLAGAMIAIFLGALDQMIVTTALPSIAADLGDVALLSWVVTGNLVTSTCAMAVSGKLSDVYGRRPLVLGSLALFIVASIFCAFAESMVQLIVARALQGLGGGSLVTLAQTVVADIISPRERGRYAAYFSLMWASASLAGPIFGGLLTQLYGWPAIFWINLPLGLAALVATDKVLRKLPLAAKARQIDIASIVLLPVGGTTLLLALSWGGIRFPWLSPPIICAFAIAGLASWLFLRRQTRLADPLMPPQFWTDNVIGRVLPAIFLVFGGYLALCVTVPVFLQTALALAPAEVGLAMIPLNLATTLSAFLAGQYIKKHADYRRPPLLTLPLSVIGLVAMAVFAPQVTPLTIAPLLIVIGLGIGAIFPTTIVAVQNAVEPHNMGAVTGALGYARSLGGAVIAAAGTSLLLAMLAAQLPGSQNLQGLDELVRRALTPDERAAVAASYRALFAALALVMLAAIFVYARVAARPLRDTVGTASAVKR